MANTSTGSVAEARPRPCGPTMIPPTSSSTIAGTRISGVMARISGARKAITATITKLVYDCMDPRALRRAA